MNEGFQLINSFQSLELCYPCCNWLKSDDVGVLMYQNENKCSRQLINYLLARHLIVHIYIALKIYLKRF